MHAPTFLIVQDPEATQTLVLKDPKFGQTPNLIKTTIAEQIVGFVVTKESFGATISSTRIGRPYLALHSFLNILAFVLLIFPISFLLKGTISLFSGQTSAQIALEVDPTLETEAFEGVFLLFNGSTSSPPRPFSFLCFNHRSTLYAPSFLQQFS